MKGLLMNKKIILLLATAFILGFSAQTFAEEPKEPETNTNQQNFISNYVQKGYESVLDTYNEMIVGYNTQNMDVVLETLADRDDIVFFGSGNRYMLLGKTDIKDAFKKDFDNLNNFNISIPWITIQGDGNVAWLNSILNLTFDSNDKNRQVIGRQTVVFKKDGDEWKIVSSHFSFPALENDDVLKEIQQTELKQTEKFKN